MALYITLGIRTILNPSLNVKGKRIYCPGNQDFRVCNSLNVQ